MPYLVHYHHRQQHRRRHSWPYCGGGTQHQQQQQQLNWAAVQSAQQQQQQLLEQQFLVPVGSEDLLDDDAASAGIASSATQTQAATAGAAPRPRRWWSSWWHPSSRGASPSPPRSGHLHLTTTSPGSDSEASPLRKMMRPPLDKAKSLFVTPTIHHPVAGDDVVFTTYWVSPPPSSVQVLPAGLVESAGQEAGLLAMPVVDFESGGGGDGGGLLRGRIMRMEARNHRRCHSEQPRAWKPPSASLWPLAEE
ncbi:uncharacterized protein BP01DRAFT_388256 [Aspergillus saccharolyticus JOP 1030-1]|uniref:Uncharacterized protein n=1 Tax=Aspergillus saccharolyticus JOP 1030-1 TaxID=1450539 RepID=A0A318ZXX1_9EURO|nr:hypothetical protein BP01DRAFT_388256 [Aspergillus saccharolyticus JOP 1030-1]PYH49173.1 hypothetical protein BP01DRAFT_388256 [Aspergillus saccharolyticus JOP 1030-1]